MKRWLVAVQIVFYVALLGILVGRAVTANFSHDENQFVAAGQLLANRGLLPYVDYPYTHMPYAAAFYGATAASTNYDYLGARLLNAVVWFLSAVAIIKAFEIWRPDPATPASLTWELTVAAIFVFDPILGHVIGEALNHSFASLFSLLAVALLLRGLTSTSRHRWHAFGCGVFVSLAAWTRFNYASLIVVLGLVYLLPVLRRPQAGAVQSLTAYGAGALAGALPALCLFAAAPEAAYYGNLVYIKLNTIYYAQQLYRANMQLGQKILGFWSYLGSAPLDALLYVVAAGLFGWAAYRYIRTASTEALGVLTVTVGAATLAASAFAPTPTQLQYFLAPVPWLCVGLLLAGQRLHRYSRLALGVVAVCGLAVALTGPGAGASLASVRSLSKPSEWVPVQAHAFAENLLEHAGSGRVLTLLPMFPLEAGLDVYPFAATGTFSWRTSLLLTAQRRTQYGVTSPDELPGVLKLAPPTEILTGFESTNAGFEFRDLGGLEKPLTDYAQAHGYDSAPLPAPFLEQSITLWWKQP
jgi:4-amino-4-deoxy-L-arabinose transferase-like glycosyltransferase